ncbi:MAG: hypothetical protein D6719_10260 [Candidatus Dadabacteria bacterium]|nr:MAG: hypothetical protein D6719_10260 [Candidatus Dadabacteria bacterium]
MRSHDQPGEQYLSETKSVGIYILVIIGTYKQNRETEQAGMIFAKVPKRFGSVIRISHFAGSCFCVYEI